MTDIEWNLLSQEDIDSLSAGDYADIDDIVHSLQHLGYPVWYYNQISLSHMWVATIWLGKGEDYPVAVIESRDMTGSMIESWNGVDEEDKIPEDDLVDITCGYCGETIKQAPNYNGHQEPHDMTKICTCEKNCHQLTEECNPTDCPCCAQHKIDRVAVRVHFFVDIPTDLPNYSEIIDTRGSIIEYAEAEVTKIEEALKEHGITPVFEFDKDDIVYWEDVA